MAFRKGTFMIVGVGSRLVQGKGLLDFSVPSVLVLGTRVMVVLVSSTLKPWVYGPLSGLFRPST